MEIGNFWTVVLSAAALAVSGVSLYFSTFRKNVSMVGSLVSWRQNEPDPMSCECEVAIANSGNQELLIREAAIEPVPWREHELTPELSVESLPMILRPGSIVTLKIVIPKLFIEELGKESRKIFLEFQVVSPKAKVHFLAKLLTPFTEGSNIPAEDWNPFKLKTQSPNRK